jgi:UDP-N-acetylglucosamine/UDP-N-acetylgalactosamine diphosphorylase
MKLLDSMSSPELIESYRTAGQGHVFAFFDQLSECEQQQLLSEAAEIDLHEIATLKKELIDGDGAAAMDYSDLEPSPFEARPEKGGDADAWAEAERLGEQALRAGRVAAFTVAGGQGTRLGFDGPKGTFPITPVRRATLFQVFAEKITAAAKRYGTSIPWLIMTSHQNHEATVSFFADNAHFGLEETQVRFFRQGRMPAVNREGRIMLSSRSSIAMSPDGHGGSLRALDRSGALAQLEAEGIDTISYFQVDNPLVRCIDPAFIGWHLKSKSEMSSKMVPKAYAEEKVGHFCIQGDRAVVVEYSDLPAAMQAETDSATGALRFIAGSIAIHVLDRNFVKRLAGAGPEAALPFHLAHKKIPTVDGAGDSVSPTEPNGIKFEMFVFDALPFAQNPIVIETLRENDFSPVKNATGIDSADSCRADLLRQYTRWANVNGAAVATDETGSPSFDYEVCPSYGYDENSFTASWANTSPPPLISAGTLLA